MYKMYGTVLGTLPYLFKTVRIRICIKQSDPNPYQIEKQDTDQYQIEKQDQYLSEKQGSGPGYVSKWSGSATLAVSVQYF
jgi:hypothetical protein